MLRQPTRYERAQPRPVVRFGPTATAAGDAIRNWLRHDSIAKLALAFVLLTAGLFTGINIFNYPQFESDEGTYIGSAWAMMVKDQLSYYTYTYDHPPLGWLQLGVWARLTGGFDTFGMSVNSGRVLMLGVAILSTLLIFQIVRNATERVSAALFGSILFAVSPLAVSLHRQVWLDNLATLWLLVSLYLLVTARERMGRIVLSSLTFGVMFWTKEVFIAFLPGMLLLAWAAAHPVQRRFVTVLWGSLAAASVSLFVVLAMLKNELLPPGVLGSNSTPHVSLVDTYRYQASRGGGGSLLSADADFWTFMGQWRDAAPFLIVGGLLVTLLGLLLWRRQPLSFSLSVLVLTYVLFLGRGGVVLYYYIIPLIALLSLAIGVATGMLLNQIPRHSAPQRVMATLVVAIALLTAQQSVGANHNNFHVDSTSSQRVAASWIADNLPRDNTIIMDSYLWTDLRLPSFTDGRPFPNAHYYWPALQDPAIRDAV
ncbi:MAG TPA: hypothetical protein VFV93_07060, partial [Thermomicrobiales bacterium]|nr:hypothetical protein [Thermomicrobiales bacterium]